VTHHRLVLSGLVALVCWAIANPVRAQPPPDAGRVSASCIEHLPGKATRPQITETFPDRGFSGYAAELVVEITHGKGETVLPEGFRLQSGSDAARALERAGFVIPQIDGGAAPQLSVEQRADDAVTTLTIPMLLLPDGPGRHELTLPALPIAVARASGQLVTICTQPHPVLVQDPTGNEQEPQVQGNPPPRPQREEWVLLKHLTMGILAGILAGILLAWLIRRWLRRPKPAPVVPKKLPWILALEELADLRASTLLSEHKADEYFDGVSSVVRKYLGARYGFDGLESTTREMRSTLRRIRPNISNLKEIGRFLEDCDLVKFAGLVPSDGDCVEALGRGEAMVMATTPPQTTKKKKAAKRGGAPATPPAAPDETKADETKADETKADETKADETKADETKTRGVAGADEPPSDDEDTKP